jgi:hypothetical protein
MDAGLDEFEDYIKTFAQPRSPRPLSMRNAVVAAAAAA